MQFDTTILTRHGLGFTYVDTSRPELVREAIRPNTKMVWIETPTNPLLKVSDVEALAKIAHERGIKLAVDSTFATPALLRPLEWGADIVMHSTTKYLSGHNQIIGGAVITNDAELNTAMHYQQKAIGAVPSPFDCWLTLAGLKTLHLRMARHSANGLEVARYLEAHPAVARVSCPGLASHPRHEVAKRQMKGGFSGWTCPRPTGTHGASATAWFVCPSGSRIRRTSSRIWHRRSRWLPRFAEPTPAGSAHGSVQRQPAPIPAADPGRGRARPVTAAAGVLRTARSLTGS
jgi:O-acetylhomoserine/O-acetylserine sulfhydrylase-like pyridoxal-dependent enzyme